MKDVVALAQELGIVITSYLVNNIQLFQGNRGFRLGSYDSRINSTFVGHLEGDFMQMHDAIVEVPVSWRRNVVCELQFNIFWSIFPSWLDNMERIMSPKYMPTIEDYVRIPMKQRAIQEQFCSSLNATFLICPNSGERRKWAFEHTNCSNRYSIQSYFYSRRWIHMFEIVSVVLFFVDISR